MSDIYIDRPTADDLAQIRKSAAARLSGFQSEMEKDGKSEEDITSVFSEIKTAVEREAKRAKRDGYRRYFGPHVFPWLDDIDENDVVDAAAPVTPGSGIIDGSESAREAGEEFRKGNYASGAFRLIEGLAFTGAEFIPVPLVGASIKSALKAGRLSRKNLKKLSLDEGKAGKHIKGNNNFDPKKSVWTHPDPEGLFKKFAGKGTPTNNVPVGRPGSIESIDTGEMVGMYVKEGQKPVPTTRMKIHYAKKSYHTVPSYPYINE